MSFNVVAIDGPAGTGKSSSASTLAHRLGFQLLDTGALYRSVTYVCLKEKIGSADESKCAAVVNDITLQHDEQNGKQRMFYKNEDITDFIRTEDINKNINRFSGLKTVRENVNKFFQKLAKDGKNSYVVEGRDIGSVIFPEACCKIYLTADPSVRANRRALQEQGGDASKITPELLQKILESVNARDTYDKTREFGPLIQTEDAVLIDTSKMEFAEVIDKLEDVARKRCKFIVGSVSERMEEEKTVEEKVGNQKLDENELWRKRDLGFGKIKTKRKRGEGEEDFEGINQKESGGEEKEEVEENVDDGKNNDKKRKRLDEEK